MTDRKGAWKFVLGGLVGGFVIGFGWTDLAHGKLPQLGELAGAIGLKESDDRLREPSAAFLQALGNIDAKLYGTPDRQRLVYAAVQGMLNSLDDPYTVLMEPEQADRFREASAGAFIKSGGIGAELLPDPMGPRVRHVFKGGPAYEAGVLPDDVVVRVDGKSVAGEDVTDVVSKIRGEPGTTVRMSFYRESDKSTREFLLTRRLAQIQDVYGSVLKTGYAKGKGPIGYIELRKFSATIPQQYDEELATLTKQGIKGLVIDLRGNPGGIMQAAVDLCARFFEGKLVTSMRTRFGPTESYYAQRGNLQPFAGPVVLLIDLDTASAAEIFAGALKNYKLATLVGEHTYGKGAVQKGFSLSDGAQAKITIGRYYLPNGESVERILDDKRQPIGGGVAPDVEVKRSPGNRSRSAEDDEQLKKAVNILQSKLG